MNQNFSCLHLGLPDDILRRRLAGDFAGAVRQIDARLEREDLPPEVRGALTAHREIIRRLPDSYPYTREQVLDLFRQHIPDFTAGELEELDRAGRLDWIYVDGEPRYFDRIYDSVLKTDRSLALRAGDTARAWGLPEQSVSRVEAVMREKGQMSVRIRIRASVRIKDACFVPGQPVRVHLPIPCACEQQSEIRIERLEPPAGQIAPEDAPQRTVCWEEVMEENHPFTVEYSYIHTARYHDLRGAVPSPEQPDFDTEEQLPHIAFTPAVRELAAGLTRGLDSPLDKARAFYDFITDKVRYTFMRPYFCLEDIPGHCLRNLTGDCGVMSLLFITLCRCAGIPARWQSGLEVDRDGCGAHDWAMFYVAPLGWLYADPSGGNLSIPWHDRARKEFYFGNLDPYRMAANSRFQAGFTVPKAGWRADPYDNQVGEVEAGGRGLCPEEYERTKEVLLREEL